MRTVLGIDAAWTANHPSGVPLACETASGWQLAAAAGSYDEFCRLASSDSPSGQGVLGVLSAARTRCGRKVDLVAVDMPLSRLPIIGRRESDNAVSRAYGGRGAGTHSPSAIRPGPISDRLRADLEQAGYLLRTSGPVTSGLIEVYPHPALIELTASNYRLSYKVDKRRAYWPDVPASHRSLHLWRVMREITEALENEIAGVNEALRAFNWERARAGEWKAYEDKLDAVVCAAVAICVLEGRASPYGDEDSAIWIPKPGSARPARRHIIGVRTRW